MIAAALEASTREASLALTVEGQMYKQHLQGTRVHASDMVPRENHTLCIQTYRLVAESAL